MKPIEIYHPIDEEEYMNEKQIEYFRTLLLTWRNELLQAVTKARSGLQEKKEKSSDVFDVATNNTGFDLGIGDMRRVRRNLELIDIALTRIENGEYGYCDLTGNEIGIKRLLAQPTATLCTSVQEMLERNNQAGHGSRRISY